MALPTGAGGGTGPAKPRATFAHALQQGARGLETDAWLTADGAVVLDHGGVHRAARSRHRPIAEAKRADLPAHLPTLDDLYERGDHAFPPAIDAPLPMVGDAVIDIARRHDAV